MPSEQPGSEFKPGSAQRPFYGIEPVLMDANGQEVTGNEVDGALCIKRPWPGKLELQKNKNKVFQALHVRFMETMLDIWTLISMYVFLNIQTTDYTFSHFQELTSVEMVHIETQMVNTP